MSHVDHAHRRGAARLLANYVDGLKKYFFGLGRIKPMKSLGVYINQIETFEITTILKLRI